MSWLGDCGMAASAQMMPPQWKELPGIVLVVALVSFLLYWHIKNPNWQRPTGFGTEWQCTPSARSGPDFCLKLPPAKSGGNAAVPPN
jgi:hypothetical protein